MEQIRAVSSGCSGEVKVIRQRTWLPQSIYHQGTNACTPPGYVPNRQFFFFQFWLESISLSVFLFFLFLISLIKGTVNWKGKTCQNAENSENTSFQIVQLGAGKMTRAPYNPVQTENWKITQLACAIYVCYVPSAKQLLLNKWQTR